MTQCIFKRKLWKACFTVPCSSRKQLRIQSFVYGAKDLLSLNQKKHKLLGTDN